MKTKFYWVALLASAALIGPAQAGGGNHGGGSGGGGGHFAASGSGSARSGGGPSFHSNRKLRRRTDGLFGPAFLIGRDSFAEIDGVPSAVRPFECGRIDRFASGDARKYQSRRSSLAILQRRKSRDYEFETRGKWRRPSPDRK